MKIEQHDIDHEFPEFHDKLRRLRKADMAFADLVERHDELDQEIHKIEEREQPVSDLEIEKLKLERSGLKDRIWGRLKSA